MCGRDAVVRPTAAATTICFTFTAAAVASASKATGSLAATAVTAATAATAAAACTMYRRSVRHRGVEGETSRARGRWR